MFRIQIDPSPDGLRYRFAGRFDAEAADEARRVLVERGGVRCADLSQVGPVDDAGLALLEELRGAGVALEGLSPYLALRLATARARASEVASNDRP